MTRPFKHFIVTRFNINLYAPEAKVDLRPDEWMEHRLRLFTSFTLPSIAGQTCQDFTWLVAVDPRTPDATMRRLEDLCLANMKLVIPTPEEDVWLAQAEPGEYDLLTTRIDNDDALHRETVAALRATYQEHRETQRRPWVMVFPLGLIMDLVDRQAWVMEYWFNNSPTLVEARGEAKTVWYWQHDQIPPEVVKCYIKDKPYWLQVVHTQNLRNAVESDNPLRKVHRELAVKPEHLRQFGIDPDRLPIA
jgi:hypothetical protein